MGIARSDDDIGAARVRGNVGVGAPAVLLAQSAVKPTTAAAASASIRSIGDALWAQALAAVR